MSTTEDPRGTGARVLDLALTEALKLDPPPEAIAAADLRMRAAIERARGLAMAPRKRGIRTRIAEGISRTSRRRRVIALLATVVILGGASRGLLGMYEAMVGPAGGTRTAWERAAVLGVSQTIDGYRVTIERVYADANQLMLAMSVRALDERGWTQVAAMGVEVTDEEGRSFNGSMSMSSPDGASTAANIAWLTPPAGLTPGPHTLHLSIPAISVRDNTSPPPDESPGTPRDADSWNPWHRVEGPWAFTIEVDVEGGAVVRPDAAAAVGGVEVRLIEVTISASTVSARLRIRGVDEAGDWSPIGAFQHAGRRYSIDRGSFGDGGSEINVEAGDGTTEAAGRWTLRIDELVGQDGETQVRLQGPWVMEFSAP